MAVKKYFYGWYSQPGGGYAPSPGIWMDSVDVIGPMQMAARLTTRQTYILYVAEVPGDENPIGGLGLGGFQEMFSTVWVYKDRWYRMTNVRLGDLLQAMLDGPGGTFYYMSLQ